MAAALLAPGSAAHAQRSVDAIIREMAQRNAGNAGNAGVGHRRASW